MRTLTFLSVPPDALTVIPFDGSAPRAPLPGVIVTAGPAGVGFADGAAAAPVPVADAEAPCAAGRVASGPPLVHPASAMPSTATAAAPVSPMRLMQ